MKTNSNIGNESLGNLLTQYYQGSLSPSEKANLEQAAESDLFLAEAMEGFDEFPEALESIPDFKPKKNPFTKIAVGGIALIGIVASIYYFSFTIPTSFPEENIEISEEINPKQEITVAESKLNITENFEGMDNEVEEKSIPKSVQKIMKEKTKPLAKQPEKVEVKREQITIPKIELTPKEFQEKIDYSVRKAKTKSIGYFGFLAIDYSLIYTNTIEDKPTFSGTDASRSHFEEQSSIMGNGLTRNIYTYKEYLKQTCYLMKERNFSMAIQNLKVILTAFPRDANAEFYLGYCYYELGEYKQAIPYFDLAFNNGFGFFEEDAQWFKANCLENSGNISEAKKIYKAIKLKGGYYSQKIR